MTALSNITEQFYAQVSESIKLLFDLTSRIDERIKTIIEKHNVLEHDLKYVLKELSAIDNRVHDVEARDFANVKKKVEELDKNLANIENIMKSLDKTQKDIDELEKRIRDIEIKMESVGFFKITTENRWKTAFDVFWKIVIIVSGAFLMYHFGLRN